MYPAEASIYPEITKNNISSAARCTADEIVLPKLAILWYLQFIFDNVEKFVSSPLKRGHYYLIDYIQSLGMNAAYNFIKIKVG